MVTLIVTTYNSEKYVRQLVELIQELTVPVIISDDGSVDGTPNLLKKIDLPNVCVLLHENMGVSGNRNFALKKVETEYVSFLDADDLIDVAKFVKACRMIDQTNVDVAYFCSRSRTKVEINENNKNDDLLRQLLFFADDSRYSDYYIPTTPWGKFFSMAFLKRHDCEFPPDIHYGEDLIFNLRVATEADQIAIYPWGFYKYRQHKNSTSESMDFSIGENTEKFLKELSKVQIDYHLYGLKVVDSIIEDSIRVLRRKQKRTLDLDNLRRLLVIISKKGLHLSFSKKVFCLLLRYKMYGILKMIVRLKSSTHEINETTNYFVKL